MNNKTFSELIAVMTQKTPGMVRVVLRVCDQVKCMGFLARVFWMADTKKSANFSDTAEWFGNSDQLWCFCYR